MNIIFVILTVSARLITPTLSAINYEEVFKLLQTLQNEGKPGEDASNSSLVAATTQNGTAVFVKPVTPPAGENVVPPLGFEHRPPYRPPSTSTYNPYPNPYPLPTTSPQQIQYNLNEMSRRVDRLESLNELWRENFQTMRERFRRLLRKVNALS